MRRYGLCLVVALALALAWTLAANAQDAEGDSAIVSEWEALEQGECDTTLYFRKVSGGWFLGAEGDSALLPIEGLFPDTHNQIERILEIIGAGDPVTMNQFLRFTGDC